MKFYYYNYFFHISNLYFFFLIDLFWLFIIMWRTISSPLFNAFLLIFIVIIVSLQLCWGLINWFSFILILLWINGLLIIYIYVASIGKFISPITKWVILFYVFFFNIYTISISYIIFLPSLTFLLRSYIIVFLFLLLVCIFLIDLFVSFCVGPLRGI